MKRRRLVWRPLIFLRNMLLVLMLMLAVGKIVLSGEITTNKNFPEVSIIEGDTLWGLAKKYYPNHDPRKIINRISEVNKLEKVNLKPGQKIKMPPADGWDF